MMEYEIGLTNLRFHARHGVWEQENKVGNEFIVDVKVRIPYTEEILTDDLNSTISYADIYEIVENEMGKPRKLLETVAAAVLSRLKAIRPGITSGSIRICKSNPPIARISGSSEVTLFF